MDRLYSYSWNETASVRTGECGSLLFVIPTLLCLSTSPVHHSLELWVVQIPSNLSYMFWLLEASVGCVEKPEMVTRRWKKSEQQPGPWPWLAPTLNCSFLKQLDFSRNRIVVGTRWGQPCSKMPRVQCIHFFPWQLRRQLIYTLPPISFEGKI